MKKAFKFMAIAAIAFGMSMTVACTDDSENSGNGGNGNGNGNGNTENLPTTLNETFDEGLPATWTLIDADGDGMNWISTYDAGAVQNISGYNNTGCMVSMSWYNGDVLYPDNYMVTPKLYINDGATLTWKVAAQDADYPEEHYAVLIGTLENGNFVSRGTLFEETFSGNAKTPTAYYDRSVDLSSYKGQSLYIAFRHYNCSDMFYLNIDNVQVQ